MVKSLVLTDNLKVYPIAFGNDRTALKPSLQFDERAKVDIGLEDEIRLEYIKENAYLSKKELEHGIVIEALVLSITTLDNNCSLPEAVEYSTKTSKKGDDMKSFFTEQIKILQVCESCQKYAKDMKLTLPATCINLCESEYLKDVCDQCKDAGFTSYIPPMKPCKRCIESNLQCIKRVVMILTSDCKEGNKQCMSKLRNEIEEIAIDPHLSLLSVLPDCPHILKTCKASFSDWYLELKNEWGYLALLYTLRNKVEPEVRKTIKNFLKSNDYVRNRDWQDPTAVSKLCNKDLTEYITSIGYIYHTIIPETARFTTSNRLNTYPNIANISVGPHGYLFFLTHETI